MNNLIGVSKTNRYESPTNPDLLINTEKNSIDDTVDAFYDFVIKSLFS